jgi:hypothetical protein
LKIQTFFLTVFRVTHLWICPHRMLLFCEVTFVCKYLRKKDFRILLLGVRSRPSPHHSTFKEITNSDHREILVTVVPHKVEVMFIHLRNESILKNSAFLFESLSAH